MEINVGDYVRYKEFSYDKEVKIGKKVDVFGNVDTSRGRILEHNITKHSKDIIDLIEVGDIAKLNILENNFDWGKGIIIITIYSEEVLTSLKENVKSNNCEILKILTHEQFETNAYKIEKERYNE